MFKHRTNIGLALAAGWINLIISAVVGTPSFAGPALVSFILALIFNYLVDIGGYLYERHVNKEKQ